MTMPLELQRFSLAGVTLANMRQFWEGYHESSRCSWDTYPESYITRGFICSLAIWPFLSLMFPGQSGLDCRMCSEADLQEHAPVATRHVVVIRR